jgi:hypothetical protein
MGPEVPLLEHIVAQQWDPSVPVVAQQLDLKFKKCKDDLRALLEDVAAQQWPGIALVQE